jgi:transposase
MTPRRAIGLMLRRGGDLTEEERTALRQLTQLHPHIQGTQALLKEFLQMLRDRRGEELTQWLAAASHSGMAQWRAFVCKLRQDQVAVQAGLTLKWNTRWLEGHINRLKLLKRGMYWRAKFDLLRQRVLYRQRECV